MTEITDEARKRGQDEHDPATINCKYCGKPVERCSVRPAHFGCSSAYGWIHANGGAHACEPRSNGPYAEPPAVPSPEDRTWTCTRLQLIEALMIVRARERTVVPEGLEAAGARADAILALLPEHDSASRECAYDAGRADGLLEFAQALSEMADMAMPHGAVRGALVKVAELARERAEAAADGLAGGAATSDSPEAQNRPEGREGCGADLCLPDFAGGSIVLRCDIPPAEHPGLNHHDPAYGAWWQPCDLPDHGHRES